MPKILAIDDISDNLISLKAIIDDAFPGSVVLTALNGPKGIELAIANNPDVILLDIIMPDMDGFEVCQKLKHDERVSDIPVVFLTALKGDKINRIKALEVGAEGFLSKPIDETELTAQIRAMVKIKAASEQKRDEKEKLEKLVQDRTRELIKSQAQLKGIFENLQDAYFQADLSGKLILISPSVLKMHGYHSIDELLGQHAEILYFEPKERHSIISILRTEGQIKDYVTQGRKKDGTAFWVSLNIQWLWGEDGQIIGTEGVVRDITDRINSEKALRESEERFQLLFNKAPLGYQSLDLYGHLLEVNQQWLDTLGYTREEVIGKWFGDFLSPDHQKGFRIRFPLFKAQGYIHSEFEMVHKNGAKLFIAFDGKVGYDLNGEFKQTHCILQDITENRKIEKALRESEEKYRSMVDLLPDAVIIHEGDKFVFANAAALKIAGADSFDQLIERPLMDYVHPDFRNGSMERIKQIYSTGQPSEFIEEKFISLKNEIVDVEVLGIPVTYTGKPAIQTIIRDISERRRAELSLQKSEAQFRNFFEKAADAIFIAEIESGIIVDANESACRLTQRQHNELIGIHQTELHPPVKLNYTKDTFKKHKELVKNNLISYAIENTVVRADGIEVPVEILASEVDYRGKLCMMGTFRDITERNRTEKALRESEYFFRESQRAAFLGSYKLDINNDYWSSSEVLDHIFGIDENHNRNVNGWLDITHPDDRDMIESYFRKEILTQKHDFNKEYRIIRKSDGETRWVLGLGKLDFDERNNVISMIGTIQDITKRKRIENDLRRSNTRFELAMEAANMSWWEMDLVTGKVVFEKRKAEMLGFPPEKFKHYNDFMNLVHPHDYEHTMGAMRAYLNGETDKYEIEYRIKSASGIYIWFYDIGSITKRDLQGNPIMVAGLVLNITDRKEVEMALVESQKLFKELFNASPDAIVLIDPHHPTILWPIIDCNEAACRLNGYTREEMIGQSIDLLNGTNENPEDRISYYNILKQEGIIHREIAHLHKDGHIFPIETSSSIISFGGREMVLGIDRDITERKQAEALLKESEDRYRQFVSQVSEGVYRFESDQPIDISLPLEEQIDFIYDHMFVAECNEAFLKMYGIKDPDEMIGKGHLDFHGGRSHPVNREILRAFVECGYHIENAITEETGFDGQDLVFSNNWMGIIENNHLVRMWGTQFDITEKVRADKVQQVLFAISNATLSASDLTELIELISNELGKLLDSNNFFIAFYDESTNMLSTLYEKGDRDNINNWSAEKSLTGYIIKYQKSLLATEADILKLCQIGEIEIVGVPSKIWLGVPLSVNKKVIGAIVVQSYDNPDAFSERDKLMLEFVSHQISISIERKRAEQELNKALIKAQESDRLKSAFLANMSHEVRTPLNSIIGFSELMTDPDFDVDQQSEFAKIILNSGNYLLSIISDIMDFSKIEAGQVTVYKLPLVVQKLISTVQKEYTFIAQDKGIELIIDPLSPKEEIWIQSDENRLRQVLTNLVSNAIKFTKEGSVKLGFKTTGDCIEFQVSDTGIGIPEDYHDEVFERFRQVESADSRKYGGNGLGLAISKSLVEILGGEIWMESVQMKGSTFYFTIPIGITTI